MSDQAESLRHVSNTTGSDEPVIESVATEMEQEVAWTIQASSPSVTTHSANDEDQAGDEPEEVVAHEPRPSRILCLASGKGGVGTSVLSMNLAVSLARKGHKVALVDADYGLGQLEILCDRRPTVDLEDVLSGRIAPWEALVEGPEGIMLLAGSHAARMNEAWLVGPATDELVAQVVTELRDSGVADWIIVDSGSGLSARSQTLASVADGMILVTTPEQASLAASHALLSHLRRAVGSHLKMVTVVNKASSHKAGEEAADRLIQASRLFQALSVSHLGVVRHDVDVPRAIRSRISVVQAPGWWLSTAARDIEKLASRIHEDFESWSSAATELHEMIRPMEKPLILQADHEAQSSSRKAS
ncbi:MAG: hypothetical protein RJA81_2187 [Planctomycetota bacterium]